MKPSPSNSRYTFHLLPNAHLDPVWLWDWREGLNEGLITVRTILDLMDEFPQLTFIRGESSIYEHIEKTDPKTFERVGRMAESGRWDIVGGSYNQPDTNLPSLETLCRQYERGLAYFNSRFGKVPTVAWQADSFGHTPGLPNVLSAFGLENFAFTRPNRKVFPLPEPGFWWKGDHQNSILCYRPYYEGYCSERDNLPFILDQALEQAARHPHIQVGILMGLGNHGGGPSRRHILDAEAWASAHPQVDLRFSTLHGFFKALRGDLQEHGSTLPEIKGDLGFCLRGCYSSVMKFKSAYRRAEALVEEAQTTGALVSSSLKTPAPALDQAWDGILFNSFHDILPGSSIERAFDEQLSWVGHSAHLAQTARFASLNQLALRVDTSVPKPDKPDRPADVPLLLWNPLPQDFSGLVELEVGLDYRPLWGHGAEVGSLPLSLTTPQGKPVPFQEIDTESHVVREVAWRKRVAARVELPPFGWKVLHLGYRYKPASPAKPRTDDCRAKKGKTPSIENKHWKVKVTPSGLIKLEYKGQAFLSGKGLLHVVSVDDVWGSWGGMKEEPDSFQTESVQNRWSIGSHAVLEEGPERAVLWTRWKGGSSWMDLAFHLDRGAGAVRVKARLLWNERSARLKLVLPCEGPLEMQVPGSRIERSQPGHLPLGRWFRRGKGRDSIGFASDVLSDMDSTTREVRVTLARASRYADDVPTTPKERLWAPASDCGELRFEFLLAPGNSDLEQLSRELLHPPVVLHPPAHTGSLPDSGSLARLEPAGMAFLSLQTQAESLSLRIQNQTAATAEPVFYWQEKAFSLGSLQAGEIKTLTLPVPS